ncbi:MAG: hypothetical protein LBG12_01960, partial [Synergistaceae bacterium]|jgi:carbon starvation protein CstA|nr:hypothetical protein [Synergistaceae bacterium]
VLEGFIAMIWAAAAIGVAYRGVTVSSDYPGQLDMLLKAPTLVIGTVARDMLGNIGGMIAILGVIVLPVTSGDTALRSLRLMIADYIHLDQKLTRNRLYICVPVFALVIAILYWAKMSPNGFNTLWRYFAWSNQTISIFAFAIITIYMLGKGYQAAAFMSLLPGMWYAFITFTFICNAPIGFNIPINIAYVLGVIFAFVYGALVYVQGNKVHAGHMPLEAEPVYAKGV